jgi:hypothetical protein
MRVLFVGNSYTLYHDVPAQVAAIAASLGRASFEGRRGQPPTSVEGRRGQPPTSVEDRRGQPLTSVEDRRGQPPTIEPHSVLQGGADWKLHRDALGTPARIAEGFDAVVLQGKSTDPLLARFAFARHGAALACLARRHGARVIFEQTWAWAADHPSYRDRWTRGSPEAWAAHVRRAYARLALVTSAEIAPVGDAWLRALRQAPSLDLHDADRHHASPIGAHLAALVLVTTLARVDVRHATWRPSEVPEDVARTLRAIAATT